MQERLPGAVECEGIWMILCGNLVCEMGSWEIETKVADMKSENQTKLGGVYNVKLIEFNLQPCIQEIQ